MRKATVIRATMVMTMFAASRPGPLVRSPSGGGGISMLVMSNYSRDSRVKEELTIMMFQRGI